LSNERKESRARDLKRFSADERRIASETDLEEFDTSTGRTGSEVRRAASQRENPDRRRNRSGRSGRGSRGWRPLPVILVMITVALLTAIVTYQVAYNGVEQEFIYSRQPVYVEEGEAMNAMRTSLEEGNSMTTAIRKGFKDYIVIYNSNRYTFIPVNFNLKMHNRVSENVTKIKKNEWEYREHGKTVSYKGIDVSSHQEEIDWKEVAGDKVQFAMLRAVYRGYESGKLVVDARFDENAKNATENGIAIGAYLFSQAINEQEIDEEVDLLLSTISPYEVKCPVVMDIELTEAGTGRADGLTMEERTALVIRFCEKVKEAGYTPMLYYNFESAMTLVDIEQLEDYEKWFATYTTDFYYPYYYSIWQYSNTGTVNGITGDVDMDMSFKKYW